MAIHKKWIEAVKSPEGGVVEYEFSKPNRQGLYPKIACVKDFAVGAGVYVDDVQRARRVFQAVKVIQDIARQTNQRLVQNAASTHEVAATVNEIARTADELSKVASGLRHIVQGFNL